MACGFTLIFCSVFSYQNAACWDQGFWVPEVLLKEPYQRKKESEVA